MIGESLLGLLATLACTAGFASRDLWHEHYESWHAAQGLTAKIDAFIKGCTLFVGNLGISQELASGLIAMVVVSFALTTLDSATRLLRFNIEEIGATFRIAGTGNRYVSSLLACGAIAFFAFFEIDGRPAALALWALFGTTNQLLAGLTLLTVTLYLVARGKNPWFTALPMLFMLGSTVVAMVFNLGKFSDDWTFGEGTAWPLLAVGAALMVLAVLLLIEAVGAMRRTLSRRDVIDSPDVFPDDGPGS